jgi:hypothetical protein
LRWDEALKVFQPALSPASGWTQPAARFCIAVRAAHNTGTVPDAIRHLSGNPPMAMVFDLALQALDVLLPPAPLVPLAWERLETLEEVTA